MPITKIYMKQIEKFGRISGSDEVLLADMIENGTEEEKEFAINELITSNLKLVVKIANDFDKDATVDFEDLVACGNIGLMRAARRFKNGTGAKFSTYAAWWIKQAIKRYIDTKELVRIPCTFNQKIKRVYRLVSSFETSNGRKPTINEVSEITGYTEKEIEDIMDKRPSFVSVDVEIGDEGSLHDVLASNSESQWDVEKEDLFEKVVSVVKNLNDIEKMIIIKRFGLDGKPPQKLEEISVKIGKTKERVRQIQDATIKKIRRVIRREL